jgi:hypothetical protein
MSAAAVPLDSSPYNELACMLSLCIKPPRGPKWPRPTNSPVKNRHVTLSASTNAWNICCVLFVVFTSGPVADGGPAQGRKQSGHPPNVGVVKAVKSSSH